MFDELTTGFLEDQAAAVAGMFDHMVMHLLEDAGIKWTPDMNAADLLKLGYVLTSENSTPNFGETHTKVRLLKIVADQEFSIVSNYDSVKMKGGK